MKAIEKEKIGWGFIGTGIIANEFADCLREVPDAYVAAAGSRNIATAEKFTNIHGGKPYGSYEEMLGDPDVDVVYVATPHPMHEENVILAAKYGKNILCEKPFAVSRQEAERMFGAAEKADVFIMEGLWSRFFPAWRHVREVLASGQLGEIISIEAATCWGMDRGNVFKSRLMDPALAGGSLLDAGIYSLASMSVAMGGATWPKNIYSTMRFEETGVDSDVDMLLELEGGVSAHLVSSLHRRNHETTIYCNDGKIHIQRHRNPTDVSVSRKTTGDPNFPGAFYGSQTTHYEFPYRKSGFQFEAIAVQDCLRKGLRYCPEVPKEETLILMGICDEVRRQHNFSYPFEQV